MNQLTEWCRDINWYLNVDENKELIVDLRRIRIDCSPLHINKTTVGRVKSFFGVHMTKDFFWTLITPCITKKAQQGLHFFHLSIWQKVQEQLGYLHPMLQQFLIRGRLIAQYPLWPQSDVRWPPMCKRSSGTHSAAPPTEQCGAGPGHGGSHPRVTHGNSGAHQPASREHPSWPNPSPAPEAPELLSKLTQSTMLWLPSHLQAGHPERSLA